MDLLSDPPGYDLNDLGWLIHTRSENRPPARLARGTVIEDSLVTHGCTIGQGARIERCVLSPGARVDPGAVVRDSVLLTDSIVERDAIVERAILDKRARVGERARVGAITDRLALTVLGKNAFVGPGQTIGPGCEIGPDVMPSDIGGESLAAGQAIYTKRPAHEV
jgi:glucose-1-phosphate adenylyltransferase